MSRCKGVEWECENLINFTRLLSRREVRIRVFSYYHLLNQVRWWWKVVFLIFILLFFFAIREESSSHILSSHHIALGRLLPLTPYKPSTSSLYLDGDMSSKHHRVITTLSPSEKLGIFVNLGHNKGPHRPFSFLPCFLIWMRRKTGECDKDTYFSSLNILTL